MVFSLNGRISTAQSHRGCTLLSFFTACRGTTCGKNFHGIFHGIPPNPPRTSTAYHGTLILSPTLALTLTPTQVPWTLGCRGGCHDISQGYHGVPCGGCCGGCRGGCHGTTRGMFRHPRRRAMKSYATPWDAVEMPWYAIGVTMAMPRKIQIV